MSAHLNKDLSQKYHVSARVRCRDLEGRDRAQDLSKGWDGQGWWSGRRGTTAKAGPGKAPLFSNETVPEIMQEYKKIGSCVAGEC